MACDLVKQPREMEVQLKEQREWVQGKMEHDENQRRKKEKQVMEDDTMKHLAHLENELKKKSGQLDQSNTTI
ncbi:unnamed protein product [Miscanthus lutarioriparius]|uniref:Uncharacterized protein n=1 Tax=Miscanthus lutarioriparius TaxID=422564 RepID=A0A811N842_9POAL|nr:unnamed protein product [Miscanthus lutarioriparius]